MFVTKKKFENLKTKLITLTEDNIKLSKNIHDLKKEYKLSLTEKNKELENLHKIFKSLKYLGENQQKIETLLYEILDSSNNQIHIKTELKTVTNMLFEVNEEVKNIKDLLNDSDYVKVPTSKGRYFNRLEKNFSNQIKEIKTS